MPEPLYVKVEQSFRGDTVSIACTLDGLADLLDRQVVAYEPDDAPSADEPSRTEFLNMISKESTRLAKSFAVAGPAFEAAVQPSGGPRAYAEAYAELLNDLRSTADAVRSARAPQSAKATEEAFTGLLDTLVDQLQSWPQQLRQAARRVRRNTFDIQLDAKAEVTSLYEALRKDSDAAESFYGN